MGRRNRFPWPAGPATSEVTYSYYNFKIMLSRKKIAAMQAEEDSCLLDNPKSPGFRIAARRRGTSAEGLLSGCY